MVPLSQFKRARYIVKPKPQGRLQRFGVYDTDRASFPYEFRGRQVPQDHKTEAEAQKVADQLNGQQL